MQFHSFGHVFQIDSKIGLDSKNYQISHDSIILQHLKLHFLNILFGEEKKKTEYAGLEM